jgi:tRNA A-37 threonylcarbamoyl transferase component Bud32
MWALDIHREAEDCIIRKMVHLTCDIRHPEKLQATPQARLLHAFRLMHCITRKTVRWTCDIRHRRLQLFATTGINTSTGDDLHFKKDGSLDMRFKSSKISGQPVASSQSGDLHYKKDGSLDMRYKSSKVASGLSNELTKMQLSSSTMGNPARVFDVPDYVTLKADGTPDMRTNAAKEWVASQAAKWDGNGSNIPGWVPKHKDGAVNMNTAVGRAFMKGTISHVNPQPSEVRSDYWLKRLTDQLFLQYLKNEREETVVLPPRPPVIDTQLLRPRNHQQTQTSSVDSTIRTDLLPEDTVQIDYSSLKFDDGDEKAAELGRGSFGVVMKATLNDKTVAVKKLHLDRLTKKERDSFIKELRILAHLGTHHNLVELYAYCLNPLCLVMELVKLGTLSNLLHYCDDPAVEAAMTDGRRKKNILYGIANGMLQLHSSQIVHGDLKPQNVLISEEYEAKISDFGLATLRGKSSSTIASSKMVDDDDGKGVVGGTAGYMAPELLDSSNPPEFSSDVYSFGILTNELIAEEEPYYDQYHNFVGRGPFGATNYAKLGNRPRISDETPDTVKQLITECWASDPSSRPSFEEIVVTIERPTFIIPNKVNPD